MLKVQLLDSHSNLLRELDICVFWKESNAHARLKETKLIYWYYWNYFDVCVHWTLFRNVQKERVQKLWTTKLLTSITLSYFEFAWRTEFKAILSNNVCIQKKTGSSPYYWHYKWRIVSSSCKDGGISNLAPYTTIE